MDRGEGNTVSVMVFWPTKDESLSATAFLLICRSIVDNVMLVLYYIVSVFRSTSYVRLHSHLPTLHKGELHQTWTIVYTFKAKSSQI